MNTNRFFMEIRLSSFKQEASQVQHVLSKMMEEGGLPALSTTIKRLVDLNPRDEISVQELSEIILEDLGLTSKVLQVVNTFYYNRTGHEIATVTQAIVFLGFDTIREIALEMSILILLSDTASDHAVALLAKVLVTAHLVKEITGRAGNGNTEEAFLAAFFSRVARVVLAVYGPDLYKDLEKRELSGSDSDTKRVQDLLRLVSGKLADMWKLPSNISRHFEGNGPNGAWPSTNLDRLISMSYTLVNCAFEGRGASEVDDRILELGELFYLDAGDINNCLKKALDNTKRLSPSIKRVVGQLFPDKDSALYETTIRQKGVVTASSVTEERHSRSRAQKTDDIYMELLNQVGEAVSSQRFSLSQLYLMVTEALHKGLMLDRVLLCLFTKDRTRLIVRYGIGRKAKEFRLQFKLVSPISGSPIDMALQENREVVTTWAEVSMGWSPPGESGFHERDVCICPLLVRARPIGCFLMDRAMGEGGFGAADLKKIAAMRQLLNLAAMQTRVK